MGTLAGSLAENTNTLNRSSYDDERTAAGKGEIPRPNPRLRVSSGAALFIATKVLCNVRKNI